MDNASLETIGESLGRLAGAFAERRRQGHPSYGAAAQFPFFFECLDQEVSVLRGEGQQQLADALDALRIEAEGIEQ